MVTENPSGNVFDDSEIPTYIATIRELLDREAIIENLIHNQEMPRRDLVEALVRKQNKAKVARMFQQFHPRHVAKILEGLPPEQCFKAWNEVAKDRCDEILRYVQKPLRTELLGSHHSLPQQSRCSVFELNDGLVRQVHVENLTEFRSLTPLWIDLLAPTEDVCNEIRRLYGVDLPNPAELTDIEPSARFFLEDNGEVHLHSNFLFDEQETTRSIPVALVIHHGILFTIRDEELPVFRLQRLRICVQPGLVSDAKDVLLGLYSLDLEYSADALEHAYGDLEALSRQVLRRQHLSDGEARKILAEIPHCEDVNGCIRRNVLDTRRAVSFLIRGKFLSAEQQEDVDKILRDIESIDNHTSFIFGKINFLMEATAGFVNVNQNERVNRLTYASLALMVVSLIFGIGA